MGVTDRVQHRIDLEPSLYIPPHSQRQIAHNLIQEMFDEGIIQESHSPWNSSLFMVPKMDGSYRAVVDFRPVNAVHLTRPLPSSCLVRLFTVYRQR